MLQETDRGEEEKSINKTDQTTILISKHAENKKSTIDKDMNDMTINELEKILKCYENSNQICENKDLYRLSVDN